MIIDGLQRNNVIIEPCAAQLALTERYILANIHAIFRGVSELRNAIDIIVLKPSSITSSWEDSLSIAERYFSADVLLQKIIAEKTNHLLPHWKKEYPRGMSDIITQIALAYISQLSPSLLDDFFPGLHAFLHQGGVFKCIWGEVKGEYFHSALQLGSLYIDIVKDTIDSHEKKTQWDSLHSCDFSSVQSFERYIYISKLQYDKQFFLNTCLSSLAPVYPLWSCSSRGLLSLEQPLGMSLLAHTTDYHATHSVFKSSGLFAQKLSDMQRCQIKQASMNCLGEPKLFKILKFQETDCADIDSIFTAHRTLSTQEKEIYLSTSLRYTKLINYQLTKAFMMDSKVDRYHMS